MLPIALRTIDGPVVLINKAYMVTEADSPSTK